MRWPVPAALIAAGCILALVSGASFLEVRLPGGLPVGNALAALALCSAAGAALGLSEPRTLHRAAAGVAFAGAVAWLPVSIALAGNLELNFSGVRGVAWIGLTLGTLLLALGSLAWAAIRRLAEGRGKRSRTVG